MLSRLLSPSVGLFFLNTEVEAIIKFNTICVSGLFAIRLNSFFGQKNLVHFLLLQLHEYSSWITRDQYAYQLCHLLYKWNYVLLASQYHLLMIIWMCSRHLNCFWKQLQKTTLMLVLFTVLVMERPVRREASEMEDNSENIQGFQRLILQQTNKNTMKPKKAHWKTQTPPHSCYMGEDSHENFAWDSPMNMHLLM